MALAIIAIIVLASLIALMAGDYPPKCDRCGGNASWLTIKPPFICSQCGHWYVWGK